MRLHGYCTGCRRPRLVSVSGSALVRAHARGGVVEGVCAACEEKERERVRAARGKR